jgi:hypothetical protein
MYNFGKTANLKAQQQKQMDRDLRRRTARLNKANIKPGKPNKESDTAESNQAADIPEGTS